jgi:hypothetical protein
MNVKKRWISTAIFLAVYIFGFCNVRALAGVKNSYQKKPIKVPPKEVINKVATNSVGNRPFYNQTRRPVDLSALTYDTTFSEAIDILRHSTEPPLKIVVLWRDLSENAYVEPDTPIKIDGVSGIRLRTGLELVLKSVDSGFAELGYIVKGGVIIIATKESLPDRMVTRVYDVSYLLSQPARFGFGFGFAPGLGAGWPGGGYMGYMGRAGQMPLTGRISPYTYGHQGRGQSRRGTMAEWGTGQGTRRASRISNLIRETVRPNRWR